MPRNVHAKQPADHSASIDSNDSSHSDEYVMDTKNPQGDYAEGRLDSTANSTTDEKNLTPLCPLPVRIAVGVFSSLGAIAGMALAIVGGNALNGPNDPEADLHRVMLGSGGAMLGLGLLGLLSTQVGREHPAPSNATA